MTDLEYLLINSLRCKYEDARENFLMQFLDNLKPVLEKPYTSYKLKHRDIMFVTQGHKMWVTTHGSRASKVFDSEPYIGSVNIVEKAEV